MAGRGATAITTMAASLCEAELVGEEVANWVVFPAILINLFLLLYCQKWCVQPTRAAAAMHVAPSPLLSTPLLKHAVLTPPCVPRLLLLQSLRGTYTELRHAAAIGRCQDMIRNGKTEELESALEEMRKDKPEYLFEWAVARNSLLHVAAMVPDVTASDMPGCLKVILQRLQKDAESCPQECARLLSKPGSQGATAFGLLVQRCALERDGSKMAVLVKAVEVFVAQTPGSLLRCLLGGTKCRLTLELPSGNEAAWGEFSSGVAWQAACQVMRLLGVWYAETRHCAGAAAECGDVGERGGEDPGRAPHLQQEKGWQHLVSGQLAGCVGTLCIYGGEGTCVVEVQGG